MKTRSAAAGYRYCQCLLQLATLQLTLLSSVAAQLSFSAGFSDDAVLQRSATQGAAVYGFVAGSSPLTVTLTAAGRQPQHVTADVTAWVPSACGAVNDTKTPCPAPEHGNYVWRAVLPPQPKAGGNFTLSATSRSGVSLLQRLTCGAWACARHRRPGGNGPAYCHDKPCQALQDERPSLSLCMHGDRDGRPDRGRVWRASCLRAEPHSRVPPVVHVRIPVISP